MASLVSKRSGSNCGVGEEIARALAEKGMHVIMGIYQYNYYVIMILLDDDLIIRSLP